MTPRQKERDQRIADRALVNTPWSQPAHPEADRIRTHGLEEEKKSQ